MDAAAFRDVDAERVVLGDVLFRPERAALYIAIGYNADHFADSVHAQVWDLIERLHNEGIEPNIPAVRRALREAKLDIPESIVVAMPDGVPPLSEKHIRWTWEHLDTLARCRRYAYESARLNAQLVANPTLINNGFIGHRIEGLEALRPSTMTVGLPANALVDAVEVAAEGRALDAQGIRYVVDGIVPGYGTLGMLVAYAKVGKTTFGQALGAAVAMARPFLNRATTVARVLVIAAEDPPEYTAWVARHLDVDRERMTFCREPIILNEKGLAQISATVRADNYGVVLIASWQAVVRGLIRDENDNAGAVQVVEAVKAAARATGIPWLIDAHAGKGEDRDDDADPSKAMRGASAAAGAADYTLYLRYADGTFRSRRKLSGKGRFVSLEPVTIDFDADTSTYSVAGSVKDVAAEATWRQIVDTGTLTSTPRTSAEIANAAGILNSAGKVTNTQRRLVSAALRGRPEVAIVHESRRGQDATLYTLRTQASL